MRDRLPSILCGLEVDAIVSRGRKSLPHHAGMKFLPSLLQCFGPQRFEEFEPEDGAGADRCRDEDVDGVEIPLVP